MFPQDWSPPVTHKPSWAGIFPPMAAPFNYKSQVHRLCINLGIYLCVYVYVSVFASVFANVFESVYESVLCACV